MDSVNLLVLDQSPEPAELINSLLRNSGIKIHVIHTQSCADAKRALESSAPILVVYVHPDPVDAGIEEITELAAQYGVPSALYCDLNDSERLLGLLKSTACYVIDSNNENQLISTVSRLLDNYDRVQRSREQKALLAELAHRYDLLLDSARDAIAYIHEGLHIYANRAYLEVLHLEDRNQLEGISLLEIMKLPEGNFKAVLRDLSSGQFPEAPVEVFVTRPDGSRFDGALEFSAAAFNGEPCIQMMLQKRDQAAELAAELERLRVTDPLTQLANRPSFTAQLAEFLKRESVAGSVSALLYLEPDGLGEAQETVELSGIDAYVLELAHVVREYLEEGDVAGRISDHGIAVLARRDNKQQLEAFAKAIKHAYKNVIIEVEQRSFSASCSIGMVKLGRLANDPQQIILQARKAFAEASEQGDEVVAFRPQLTAVAMAEDESLWVNRIRFALKNEDFYPAHQSIVDLDGEGEHLIENLTFLREENSEHPPSEYMAIAEKHDLAGAIDRNVIPAILRSVADNDEKQIISLSMHSVADHGFPAWLLDHLKMYAVDANKLVLQIPADAAQANLKPTQRILKELGPKGCRLSISMFGPERRSQQLFEHLEIRYVKLHPSLTADLAGNTKAQDSIRSIVEAASSHNAVVIADEISDTSNLAILWQCGVKLIAGAFLKETSQVVGQ